MSALYYGSVWPFAILVWPLLIGLVPIVPQWRSNALRLLPLAPIPALIFALAGAPGTVHIPDLALGAVLEAVPGGALLLGMTATVWTVAGWQAALSMKPGPKAGIFAGFWCLTLTGNLGVFLAADIVTFYLAFAAVSLAAWFLVVHDRSAKALSAGRLYIILAVTGEIALLTGLIIGGSAAGDIQITSLRASLPDAPLGGMAIGLLIVGFGIKAGMVPLHIWLPVAHPVAPVPGSAVLSGAIVKAGLVGMMMFLPAGTGWSHLLVGAGFAGAFGAALMGLMQSNPKVVLAYSTISQMGVMIALVGSGSAAVTLYAVHHGLAKAALFLSAGVVILAASGHQRRISLGVAVLLGLSVAGFPLTGGAVAKSAAKADVGDTIALVLSLSSITTTLILAWFLHLLAQSKPRRVPLPTWARLQGGIVVLAFLAVCLPWVMVNEATGLHAGYLIRLAAMADSLWPILAGFAAFALLRRRRANGWSEVRFSKFGLAPRLSHAVIVPLLTLRSLARALRGLSQMFRPPYLHREGSHLMLFCQRTEARLRHWPVAALLMASTVLALSIILELPSA